MGVKQLRSRSCYFLPFKPNILLNYVTITRMWYIITNNEIGQDAGAKLNLESSTNNEEGKERLREKE